jgi:hypothetical protein
MEPESLHELLVAWKSDLANFDTENPENTAGIMLHRLSSNKNAEEWAENYPELEEIVDLLVEADGVPGDYEEIGVETRDKLEIFEQIETKIDELQEKTDPDL